MTANRGACSICGGSLKRKRRFSERAGEVVYLYKCKDCLCEMLLPQPSDVLLQEEYKDYCLRRSQYASSRFQKESFFTELLVVLSSIMPQNPGFKALELGTASGDFVKAFNTLFPQATITAVERNTEGTEELHELNCRFVPAALEEYLSDCKERYDMVFMFDVLEHLRSPVDSLRMISKILDANAKVCLTVPLAGSTLHRMTGRLWPQYKLEHLFYFSKTSICTMGRLSGLEVERSIALSKVLPVSYLLSVGSNFGPHLFTRLVKCMSRILPGSIYERRIKLPLGEALVVYEKRD